MAALVCIRPRSARAPRRVPVPVIRRRPPPLACLFLLAIPSCAFAGGPTNDAWANRQVVTTLPTTDIEGAIGSATSDASDPVFPCRRTAATAGARSTWYSYTTGPDPEYVNATA